MSWQKRQEQVDAAFKRGRSDCFKGLEPQEEDSDYILGYADQYQKEQILEARCRGQE